MVCYIRDCQTCRRRWCLVDGSHRWHHLEVWWVMNPGLLVGEIVDDSASIAVKRAGGGGRLRRRAAADLDRGFGRSSCLAQTQPTPRSDHDGKSSPSLGAQRLGAVFRVPRDTFRVIEGPEPKHRDPKSDRPWSPSPSAGTRLGPTIGDDPVPVEAKSLLGPKKNSSSHFWAQPRRVRPKISTEF
ncbi:hypothetical protein NL676_005766 [Syzygium grande]|nr:hypothetical protein NL676_005766 [Syzygium grande]